MITAYTDGAYSGHVAVGGWAWWVSDTLHRFGNAEDTTSNRMELQAVIDALTALAPLAKAAGGLIIYSDSLYVVNCFADRWYVKWRLSGWVKRYGGTTSVIKNRDLWETLLSIHDSYQLEEVPLSFRHVRGHGQDKNAAPEHVEGNRMADQLAVQAKKLRMI